MGSTGFDIIDAQMGRFKVTGDLSLTPEDYYGADRVRSNEWAGGEVIFNSGDNRLYIQSATSGRTPVWKRLLEAFGTSTTSSSTSSSSTSTSTSTSSSSTTTAE